MPEMHLFDPKVEKYSAGGPFTRHKQRINDFIKDGKLSHILKNKLDVACFQHDSAYSKYKDRLNRKKDRCYFKKQSICFVKKLHNKEIAMNPKINGYQRRLASMVYKLF